MASRTRPALVLFLLLATLALPVAASAQSAAPQAQAVPQARQQLRSLERQAARLTLVAKLPQADRAQATQLLDRADALRKRALALRIQELQAYVAALQSGTAPSAARVEAQQKVSEPRLALAKDLDALRSDVQAFVQKVPQARALLRGLAAGRGNGGAAGARHGSGAAPQMRPGARDFGRSAPGGHGWPMRGGMPWAWQPQAGMPGWGGPWNGWNGPWGDRYGQRMMPPDRNAPDRNAPTQPNGAPPAGGGSGS